MAWLRGIFPGPSAVDVENPPPAPTTGTYQLQAAIAAVHDEAARVDETDWPQILARYGLLERMIDNPMVTLNGRLR